MSGTKVEIKPFDLDKIPPGALLAIIGRRFSGKSWAIRSLMYMLYERAMPYGCIFSGTEHCSPFFKNYFPDTFIYSEEDFTDERIGEILKSQGENCKSYVGKVDDCSCLHCRKNPYKFEKEKGHCIHNNMLLITDDMMSQEKLLKKSPNYRKLFTEGRHYNILYMLCLQYCLGLPPTLRSNIDYVFLYAEDEISNLKKLYENYAGIFPSFQMFKDVFDQITEDYGCLVIDKRSKSKNLTDRIFIFKAQDPGEFKFGNKLLWEQHYNAVGRTIKRSSVMTLSRNNSYSHSKEHLSRYSDVNNSNTKEYSKYDRRYSDCHRSRLGKDEKYYRTSQKLDKKTRKVLETYGESGKKYTIIID